MRTTILALAAIPALATAQTPSPTPIGAVIRLGEPCVPGGTMCALGASCYATNSMLQPLCGNFQASCTSDQQCAFNTCNGGFCNGPSPSSSATPSASPSPIIIGAVVPVGQKCTPGGTMCALGANCYAVNSMLETICGNFQASCTSDQQCAFNTCNGGFCNGMLSSSSSPTPSPSKASASASSTSTPIGAVIPLGEKCTPGGTMCALGANCYAVNSMLETRCGNFQASCTSDQQCAFNTCNGGFCNGLLASSSSSSAAAASSSKAAASSSSAGYAVVSSSAVAAVSSKAGNATMTMKPSQTTMGGASMTTSPVVFTGAAAVMNVAGGAVAMVLGAAAWAL